MVETECSSTFQKWFLPSSSCGKYQGLYLWNSLGEPGQAPGRKTLRSVGAPLWGGPSGVLYTEPVAKSLITAQVCLPQHRLQARFCSWIFALESCNSLCLLVSLWCGRQVCPVTSLHFSNDLRRTVNFQFGPPLICGSDRLATSKLLRARPETRSHDFLFHLSQFVVGFCCLQTKESH